MLTRRGRDLQEFEQVLARVGIFLPLPQLAVLCRRYDTNANRSVCIAVIVDDLVADLNDARRGIVDDLFSGLSQGAESIATATLLSSFFAGQHPKVAAGDWPASKVSDDFADLVRAFSSSGTTISRAEFVHLFRFISASMPLDDRRFVETVQATFTRPGTNLDAEGEPPVNAVYLESVGHVLKEKVRQKTRGQESEANTLTRVFHHFDLEDSGTVTWDEWQRALERFGIIMSVVRCRPYASLNDGRRAGPRKRATRCSRSTIGTTRGASTTPTLSTACTASTNARRSDK